MFFFIIETCTSLPHMLYVISQIWCVFTGNTVPFRDGLSVLHSYTDHWGNTFLLRILKPDLLNAICESYRKANIYKNSTFC